MRRIKIGILSNYDFKDYIKLLCSEDNYNKYEFVLIEYPNPEISFDGLVVLNEPKTNFILNLNSDFVISFHQEPGNFLLQPFMFFNLKQYKKVYSPLRISNVNTSLPFLPWHIKKNYKQLSEKVLYNKNKKLSLISSNKKTLKGHKQRLKFVGRLKKERIECDFFGKGTKFIEDKLEGLSNYKYSIVIENSKKPNYFTEKITDCFLANTVPIYYGCTNIYDFFPKNSLIEIDIKNLNQAIKQIHKIIVEDDYERRIPALNEAKRSVLNKYNLINKIIYDYEHLPIKIESKQIIISKIPRFIKLILHSIHKILRVL